MKKSLNYADLKAAIEKDPKAYAAASGVAVLGTAATAIHVATLTTTLVTPNVAAQTIAFTTVKAGLLSKVIVGGVCIAATATASYYVYNKLKK